MGEELPQRRRIRLSRERYADVGAVCSVTIAVKSRAPVFGNPAIADAAVDVLRRHAATTDVPVYAWCVMADHIHLVLGASPNCDIVTFVGQFKNLVQREAWRLGISGAFWHEHIEHVIEYVLNNPVRSGLVERWSDDRFSGSLVFELADGGGQAPALQLRMPTAGHGR